jgi:hypothetical protein
VNRVVSESASQQEDKSDGLKYRITEETPISLNIDAGEVWKHVLGSIGQNNLALDTILSKARPGNIQGDELTIYVQYDFHKQQLMSEKNLVKLEQIITKAMGRAMRAKIEVSSGSLTKSATMQTSMADGGDTIDEAIAIFSN